MSDTTKKKREADPVGNALRNARRVGLHQNLTPDDAEDEQRLRDIRTAITSLLKLPAEKRIGVLEAVEKLG